MNSGKAALGKLDLSKANIVQKEIMERQEMVKQAAQAEAKSSTDRSKESGKQVVEITMLNVGSRVGPPTDSDSYKSSQEEEHVKERSNSSDSLEKIFNKDLSDMHPDQVKDE